MTDVNKYIVLLERHHQVHLEDPRPVRGTFRGIEDISCIICSPITNDGGMHRRFFLSRLEDNLDILNI